MKQHYLLSGGISQKHFADLVEVSEKHLSQLINGRRRLEPGLAVRIAKTLGTTTDLWLNFQKAVDVWDAEQAYWDWKPRVVFAASVQDLETVMNDPDNAGGVEVLISVQAPRSQPVRDNVSFHEKAMNEHRNIGSDFDAFLEEGGILEEITEAAAKRVIALSLQQAYEQSGLTKTEVAKRMKTSRAQLNKLLDPRDTGITLHSIIVGAQALGRRVRITIEDEEKMLKEHQA